MRVLGPMLMLLACTAPESEGVEPCWPDFFRADDGQCYPDEANTETDPDEDTGTALVEDTDGGAEPFETVAIFVDWTADRVRFQIAANPEWNFYIGIAETVDCGEECWTGEDCAYGHKELRYCHPTTDEGVSLVYGAAQNGVNTGSTTAFSQDAEGRVSYIALETITNTCFIGGADPSYFDNMGCVVGGFN